MEMFQTTVSKRFGRKAVAGDVGIEVEAEFVGTIPHIETKTWQTKEDGSLRNGGREFVLIRPIAMKDVPAALTELRNGLEGTRTRMSSRTSVHMHINVTKMSLEEVTRVWATYFLYENLLVATQNETRQGNLFCLRGKDAEVNVRACAEVVRSSFEAWPENFGRDYRYAAMNIQPITNFGSLEFRFLGGTTDTEFLDFWAKLLYNLVNNSAKVSIDEQEGRVNRSDMGELREHFRELVSSRLADPILEDQPFEKLVEPNLPYALSILNAYRTAEQRSKKRVLTFLRPTIHSQHEDLPAGILGNGKYVLKGVRDENPFDDLGYEYVPGHEPGNHPVLLWQSPLTGRLLDRGGVIDERRRLTPRERDQLTEQRMARRAGIAGRLRHPAELPELRPVRNMNIQWAQPGFEPNGPVAFDEPEGGN